VYDEDFTACLLAEEKLDIAVDEMKAVGYTLLDLMALIEARWKEDEVA
jgi:DNA-binding transcriptional regulator YhcF (GntR family)